MAPRTLTAFLIACLAVLSANIAHAAPKPVTVTRLTWHGWPGSLRLSNGIVEALVVPAIGRIMSFGFVGHPETSPIFVNKEWDGKTIADADPTTWAAFGGDKLWPSPQSEWPRHNVRAWPPDQTFDGDPETAQIVPGGVRLVTPGSVAFAARAMRTITMKPGQPRLYIAQALIKDPDAANPPAPLPPRDGFPLGLWSITQTRGDGTVFLPLPTGGPFPSAISRWKPRRCRFRPLFYRPGRTAADRAGPCQVTQDRDGVIRRLDSVPLRRRCPVLRALPVPVRRGLPGRRNAR